MAKSNVIMDVSRAACPVELVCNQDGVPYRSAENVVRILRNDPAIAGKIGVNEFSNNIIVTGELPWARVNGTRWKSSDLNALYLYVNKYIPVSKAVVESAFYLVVFENMYHPIKEFLLSLHNEKVWDGVHRIDTFLHDYAGVDVREDTHYDSWVMKHWLLSAIHRVMVPGCKVDECLIMTGPQGEGKSHFAKALAMKPEWFCENMPSLDSDEATRVVNSAWIIELDELLCVKKTQSWEGVKAFLTRQVDTVRRLYESDPEEQPRHCVFIGSTNSRYFLSDPTGSRRFLPVAVNFTKAEKNLYDDEKFVIKQLWAEAMELYVSGGYEEKGIYAIYLTREQQAQAEDERQNFTEENNLEGIIQAWLDRLPTDKPRVCAAMIWNCALNEPVSKLNRQTSNSIHSIMQNCIRGWRLYAGSDSHKAVCGDYGKQICYERIKQ